MIVYGEVAFVAFVLLVAFAVAHLVSRAGIVIVFHVPIDVVTDVALTLGAIALCMAALLASGVAALAAALGLGPRAAWGVGLAVALLVLTAFARRRGSRLLSREIDLVAARRRARRGLPPLPGGPPRHAR